MEGLLPTVDTQKNGLVRAGTSIYQTSSIDSGKTLLICNVKGRCSITISTAHTYRNLFKASLLIASEPGRATINKSFDIGSESYMEFYYKHDNTEGTLSLYAHNPQNGVCPLYINTDFCYGVIFVLKTEELPSDAIKL